VVLVAHCFSGGNAGLAAAQIARSFSELSMAVLSLDFACVTAGGHQLVADEPAAAGGADSGPTPYDLLLAGLGACTAITVRMYADRKGWRLRQTTVRLRHRRIHAKDCAGCETRTGQLDQIEREMQFEGELTDEQRARLLDIAERCPVHRTLHSEVLVSTAESVPNGPGG
jgi:putative redox protein